MDPQQDSLLRCAKCNAPLSHSVGRCPFCGTELPGQDPSKPFVPAPIGLSESNQLPRMPTVRPRPAFRKQGANPAVIVAAGMLVFAVIAATGVMLTLRPADTSQGIEPPPSAISLVKPPLNINGVSLVDGTKVDPTDLLPQVRPRVSQTGEEAKLVGIEVIGASKGVVNLERSGVAVSYSYTIGGKGGDRVRLTLSTLAPPLERGPVAPEDKLVPMPTCVWSAAWNAAAAVGIAPDEVAEARYGYDPKMGKAVWVFSIPTRPEYKAVIDGESCAIKLR